MRCRAQNGACARQNLSKRQLIEKWGLYGAGRAKYEPNLFTALGIFFTFVGLTMGITEIDLQGSSESLLQEMSVLISGVGLAFHSSLMGISLSLLTLIAARSEVQQANKTARSVSNQAFLLEREGPRRDPAMMLEDMRALSKESANELSRLQRTAEDQLTNLSSLSTDLAEQLGRTLSDALEEKIAKPLHTLNEGFVEFQQNSLESHNDALSGVFERFNETFQNSLSSQFQDLGMVLTQTIRWHRETQQMLTVHTESLQLETEKQIELLEQQRIVFEREAELRQGSIDSMTEHVAQLYQGLEQSSANTQTIKDLATLFTNLQQETVGIIETNKQISENLKAELSALTNAQEQTLKQLTFILENFNELDVRVSKNVQSLLEDIQKNLHKGLTDSFHLFDTSTSDIVGHLSGSYVQMRELLDRLNKEVKQLNGVPLRQGLGSEKTGHPKAPQKSALPQSAATSKGTS